MKKKDIIITIAIMAIFAMGVVIYSVVLNNTKQDINTIEIANTTENINNTTEEIQPTKEPAQKVTTIKLNEVTRSVFYAPQYVAISNGFFKNENINIDITTGQGSDKVMTSILTGQSDIGLSGPETTIYVYNEGRENYAQVFAQLTKKDGSFLISRNQNDNFTWQDLKGATVIPGRKGGMPYMVLQYVIRKNGLDTSKDLVLDDSIQFDLMAGAFAGGNADYVTLFEPTASMTEEANAGYIVASVGEAAGEVAYTGYIASKEYIEKNEDIIRRFTRAIYEGQKWVNSHTAKEIAESIVEFFPDTQVELLEKNVQRYKDIDVWCDKPLLTEESFDLLQTILMDAGELQTKAPYDKIVNTKYAIEIAK